MLAATFVVHKSPQCLQAKQTNIRLTHHTGIHAMIDPKAIMQAQHTTEISTIYLANPTPQHSIFQVKCPPYDMLKTTTTEHSGDFQLCA